MIMNTSVLSRTRFHWVWSRWVRVKSHGLSDVDFTEKPILLISWYLGYMNVTDDRRKSLQTIYYVSSKSYSWSFYITNQSLIEQLLRIRSSTQWWTTNCTEATFPENTGKILNMSGGEGKRQKIPGLLIFPASCQDNRWGFIHTNVHWRLCPSGSQVNQLISFNLLERWLYTIP